jgi:hypothetical protein
VRKPKNKSNKPSGSPVRKHVSPYIKSFSRSGPDALKREVSTRTQTRWDEETIIYGENDNLPLVIAKAVEDSPATTSCLDTFAQFIKGSGFTNKDLMNKIIDKDGTTLWDFHCALADSCSVFWGFSVNLKFNENRKITNAYQLSFESVRFKKPGDNDPYINTIKYNPYFGTYEYKSDYTKEYQVFNLKSVPDEIKKFGKDYNGQVYYYGKTSPLYRFYPVPKYWSAKKWIGIDGKIQEFHDENLDNGNFQSVLMDMVGDPNEWSTNPETQKEDTDSSGNKILVPTETVGQEFNRMMTTNFSGSQKAGNVMVRWVKNLADAAKIQPFPTNNNAELFLALQDLTTKNITIATKVPSILANISEGVSLGSDGNTMQKAIELMQSRTAEWRERLTAFYNNILLPNLQEKSTDKVEIVNYNPISVEVKFDPQFWEVLTPEEKREFIKKNFPTVTLLPTPTVNTVDAPAVDPATGEPMPAQQTQAPAVNDALTTLKIADINKIQKIVARYNLGQTDPSNAKALTYDQAKQLLASFGFTEDQLNAWLVTPEEI